MNFNIKYIIIGAILVTMLVAFGRNPLKEAREKHEAEKKLHGDPLVYAIQQHNSKEGHLGNMLNGVVPGGMTHQMPNQPQRNVADPSQNASPSQLTVPGADQNNSYYPPPPLRNSP